MLLADTNETIKAIASLWQLVLVLLLGVALVFFKKPLLRCIESLHIFRVKGGAAEISLETDKSKTTLALLPTSEQKEEVSSPLGKEADCDKQPEGIISSSNSTKKHISSQNDPKTEFENVAAAIDANNLPVAEELFGKLQEAETSAEERQRNKVLYHFMMYQNGKDSKAIEKLEAIASSSPEIHAFAMEMISHCYASAGNIDEAIKALNRVVNTEAKSTDWARLIAKIAGLHSRKGQFKEALELLTNALKKVEGPNEKYELYSGIAKVYEQTGESQLRAIALEKALEFLPGDSRALFSAAYAQADAKMLNLAIVNYTTSLHFEPKDTYALNNLGVALENIGLPIKCISRYQAAADEGNTLAMANLAFRKMNTGFAKEAQEILEKAMQITNPHENVGKAVGDLADLREQENKKLQEITLSGRKQKDFFWQYAEAYFVPYETSATLNGDWKDEKGTVYNLSQKEQEITAKWEIESTGEKLSGVLHNRSLLVKYRKKSASFFSSLTASWDAEKYGFGYLDASTIVFYIPDDVPIFRTLRKVSS